MTARDGERDVAGFAVRRPRFRRPLRDVVQQYNAFTSKGDLDDLLDQLSDLLDSGILNLRPDASGKTNLNRIRACSPPSRTASGCTGTATAPSPGWPLTCTPAAAR